VVLFHTHIHVTIESAIDCWSLVASIFSLTHP
jgi:hypothetical protein